MAALPVEESELPLANRATFRLERTEAGTWLADDPEVECHAEGADPSAAVVALLQAEQEYLQILGAESKLGPLARRHLFTLRSRLA